MKVQRIQIPGTLRFSWLVLDDEYLPIPPLLAFLRFLDDVGRSPNTIRAAAHHLKVFWEFLRDEQVEWTAVRVEHLASFIAWLRHAWLYAHEDIKRQILDLRAQHVPKPKIWIPPQERASEASKDLLIAALRQRVKEQEGQIRELKRQLEVAYGQLAQQH